MGYNNSSGGAVVPITNSSPGAALAVSETTALLGAAFRTTSTCHVVGKPIGGGERGGHDCTVRMQLTRANAQPRPLRSTTAAPCGHARSRTLDLLTAS